MNEPESDGKDITENDYKLCAPIPHSLALKFTGEARKRASDDNEKIKGAIGRAVEQAIRLWLGEE